MQQELLLKAITQGTIGAILLTLLLVLLFTLRKEFHGKKRFSGIVIFALAMIGLWCFFAFAEVYVSLRKMIMSQDVFEHLDSAGMAGSKQVISLDFAAFRVSSKEDRDEQSAI